MSQRTATIESLPMAFEVVKAMRAAESGHDNTPHGHGIHFGHVRGSLDRDCLRYSCNPLS